MRRRSELAEAVRKPRPISSFLRSLPGRSSLVVLGRAGTRTTSGAIRSSQWKDAARIMTRRLSRPRPRQVRSATCSERSSGRSQWSHNLLEMTAFCGVPTADQKRKKNIPNGQTGGADRGCATRLFSEHQLMTSPARRFATGRIVAEMPREHPKGRNQNALRLFLPYRGAPQLGASPTPLPEAAEIRPMRRGMDQGRLPGRSSIGPPAAGAGSSSGVGTTGGSGAAASGDSCSASGPFDTSGADDAGTVR